MSDLGLGDNIVNEQIRDKTLIWHGLGVRDGNPNYSKDLVCTEDDGMGSDSGISPLNPSIKKMENRTT